MNTAVTAAQDVVNAVSRTNQSTARCLKIKNETAKENMHTETTDIIVVDPNASSATELAIAPAGTLYSGITGETHADVAAVAATISTQSRKLALTDSSSFMSAAASDKMSSLRLLVHQQQSTADMLQYQLKLVLSVLIIVKTEDSTKHINETDNETSRNASETVKSEKPPGFSRCKWRRQ